MDIHMKYFVKTFSLLIVLFFLIFISCERNKDNTTHKKVKNTSVDSIKVLDTIQELKQLTPNGYTLLYSSRTNITDSNSKELFLHFKTNKEVNCYLEEMSPCYMNEIHHFELVNDKWTKKFSSHIMNPLQNDTTHNLVAIINSARQLVINSYCKPTGYSNMNETHYYSYQDGTYSIDSINLTINNTFQMEYTTWEYSIDLINKFWKKKYIQSVYSDSLENFIEKSLVNVQPLLIDSIPTLSSGINAEKILKDDLTYSL